MISFDGYTTDPSLTEQARNIAARLRRVVGRREAARIAGEILAQHGYICPEFVRDLDTETRLYEQSRGEPGGRFTIYGGEVLELDQRTTDDDTYPF